MTNRLLLSLSLLISVVAMSAAVNRAQADTVVSDGRFTNVYVYPDPAKETWEQHLTNLPASQKPTDWTKFSRQSIDIGRFHPTATIRAEVTRRVIRDAEYNIGRRVVRGARAVARKVAHRVLTYAASASRSCGESCEVCPMSSLVAIKRS